MVGALVAAGGVQWSVGCHYLRTTTDVLTIMNMRSRMLVPNFHQLWDVARRNTIRSDRTVLRTTSHRHQKPTCWWH